MGDKTPEQQLLPEQEQTENQAQQPGQPQISVNPEVVTGPNQAATADHAEQAAPTPLSPDARLRKDQEALEARESLESSLQQEEPASGTGVEPVMRTESEVAPQAARPGEVGSDDAPLTMDRPDSAVPDPAAEPLTEIAPPTESPGGPQDEPQTEADKDGADKALQPDAGAAAKLNVTTGARRRDSHDVAPKQVVEVE